MATGSKHKILEVSRDLFYRRGYLATSVDDILVEAKVSKSNFYYHFKSKEDLGIAVLDDRRAEFEAALASTLCNDALTPQERLSSFLKRLAESREAHASSGCPFGNLVAEMSDHSERFRHELSSMFSALSAVVARAVAESILPVVTGIKGITVEGGEPRIDDIDRFHGDMVEQLVAAKSGNVSELGPGRSWTKASDVDPMRLQLLMERFGE